MSVAAARAFVRSAQEPGDIRDTLKAREHELTLADLAGLASRGGTAVDPEDIRRAFVENWLLRRASLNARQRNGER